MRKIFAALAVILIFSLPALSLGWLHDDYIHREMLTGSTAGMPRGFDEAYCFAGGPKSLAGSRWEVWWRSPQMTACFFRPLSSLTLAIDHTLWPAHPQLAHLHGLLWFFAACAGVMTLAFFLFGPQVAALAGLVYGVSSYTSAPVAWVAARHTTISAALVAFGLCVYLRGRQKNRVAVGGLALLMLALLGGEGALGGLGFVCAYELLGARGAWRARVLYIGAAAALGIVYVLLYVRAGYGTAGAGAYLDPLHHSGEFLTALPGRLFCLLAEAVLGVPSLLWSFSSHQLLLGGLGVLSLVLLLAALSRAPLVADADAVRTLRALGLGALLSAIPAAAAILGGRVLLVPGIGLSILFAAALAPGLDGSAGLRHLASPRVIAFALGVLLLNPLSRLAQIQTMHRLAASEQRLATSPLAGCAAATHVLLFGTDEFSVAMYAPYLLVSRLGGKSFQQLTLASSDIAVERLDANTLRLHTSPGGHLVSGLLYTMNRPARAALAAGAEVPIAAGTLHVEAAGPTDVSAVRIELPIAADDQRFCWLRYDGTLLVPITLPPVGGVLRIPYVRGPMAF